MTCSAVSSPIPHFQQMVSTVFLIDYCSTAGLFVCHINYHYPTVAWTPGEGDLVHFNMKCSKDQGVTVVGTLAGYYRLEVCDTEQDILDVADYSDFQG